MRRTGSAPRRAIVVAVTLAVAGCGGDDRDAAETRRADREDREFAAGERKQRQADAASARRVRRQLRLYFASASWYETIRKVTVSGGDVTVTTTLNRLNFDGEADADALGPARAICTTIAGPGVDPPRGVDGGSVIGSDGGVIKRC